MTTRPEDTPVFCWRCRALLKPVEYRCETCNAGPKSTAPRLSEGDFVDRYRAEVIDN